MGRGALIVLLVMGAALAAGGPKRKASVEIRLTIPKNRFVTKEWMGAKLAIRNTGSAPVEVPDPTHSFNTQPVYTITGPAYPNGHTFRYGQRPGDPASISLAPGATHEVALPLERMVEITVPGEYRVVARLDVNGVRAESAPVAFTIEKAEVRSAELMVDEGAQSTAMIRVLAVVGKAGRLMQAFAREVRPHSGPVEISNLMEVTPPPPDGATALAPWTDFDRMGARFFRLAWCTASEAGVDGRKPGERARLALPAGSAVVRPALMARSGDVDLFLRRPGEVSLARIPLPGKGDARVLWTAPLAGDVKIARAAMGRADARALLLATETAQGVRLELIEAQGAQAAPARVIEIPQARVPRGSEAALRYTADGGVRASLVLAGDTGMRRLFVADAAWPARTGEGKLERQDIPELPEAPLAAATAYAATAGADRRDWAVVLPGGKVMGSRAPGETRPLAGTPVLPLQLLSLSQLAYVVVEDPREVFAFQGLY